MREPENIRAVSELGIDLLGLIFYEKSPRFVQSVPVYEGTIPDRANETLVADSTFAAAKPSRVGVFVNAMMQDVVTKVYNYKLDYVQLHGTECPTYIDNLRRTLDYKIKIIKAIGISTADDLQGAMDYDGVADLLLFDTRCAGHGGSGEKFDWAMIGAYHGTTPFLLSGGIDADDATAIKALAHPRLAGVDLNSRFELAPAVKDVAKLQEFINTLRNE